MSSVFYTDETKLKDLTVGQLKDIIIETLNSGIFERERRQYIYTSTYGINHKPKYPDPFTTPYCKDSGEESVC